MVSRDINVGKRVLRMEGESIIEFSKRVGPEFEKAVNLIFSTRGKIIIMGMGKSGHVGKKIAATLSSTGTPSFFVHLGEASQGDLGMIQKSDIVIFISNSGNSSEMKNIMKSLKEIGPKIVCITKNKKSLLARESDHALFIDYNSEACPYNLAPTVSSTLTLALGDALAIALMLKRRFTKENYGLLHPGGNLGKESTKIKSLLSENNYLSRVLEGKSLVEAVGILLQTRMSAVAVVNKRNIPTGIISDGDLKRYISLYGPKIFHKKVKEVMTKNPVSINENSYISKAIKLMKEEKRQISALVVVDKKNKFKGILRIHDLIRT